MPRKPLEGEHDREIVGRTAIPYRSPPVVIHVACDVTYRASANGEPTHQHGRPARPCRAVMKSEAATMTPPRSVLHYLRAPAISVSTSGQTHTIQSPTWSGNQMFVAGRKKPRTTSSVVIRPANQTRIRLKN